jgi:hypothetical protein
MERQFMNKKIKRHIIMDLQLLGIFLLIDMLFTFKSMLYRYDMNGISRLIFIICSVVAIYYSLILFSDWRIRYDR